MEAVMQTHNTIEQRFLQEIKGLDQDEVEKIIKMVRFMKSEFLKAKQKNTRPDLMKYAGFLNDLSPDENELFNQAVQRKSMFKGRELEL